MPALSYRESGLVLTRGGTANDRQVRGLQDDLLHNGNGGDKPRRLAAAFESQHQVNVIFHQVPT